MESRLLSRGDVHGRPALVLGMRLIDITRHSFPNYRSTATTADHCTTTWSTGLLLSAH